MNVTLNLVGITDSLGDEAWSGALLRTLGGLLPPDADMSIMDIENFPYYIPYLDKVASSSDMCEVRASIRDSDAVLIVTPQENNGLPNTLRNAVRWLSQRLERSCLLRKPVFICSFSTGDDGGVDAQMQLSRMLSSFSTEIGPQHHLALRHIDDIVAEGVITNADVAVAIRDALARFVQEIFAYQEKQRCASLPERDNDRRVRAADRGAID
ncbi:hypothetical protein EKH79_03305 [Dyella dinghuensis]|uniref:NADPH-dependent FMN reductase-like domain-containing protein n=1 Tax=Dyella dinghuensis TaxID=1920169 RepID=A0A432LUS6_9GAMM|nr:NAD(P)H-dependent oxidoreductase [Dyella dinghuensis]RUL65751.1 hypothetical protein EKH79_03305 [Dyella dinghuensis]